MAVAMLLIGCTQKKQYRIGVSQCSSDAWRTKMNEEIEREIMFHPEATVEIRSAGDDSRKQIEDIEYFRKNNFDVIIASPNEAESLTPIIKETYESGIPVILFDRNIKGDYYTAFQDADNREIGEAAARYALNYGENPKVIEIGGLEGSTPAEERKIGFQEVADEKGIDIVGYGNGNWLYDRAKSVADSLLRLNPEADVVYAHNDIMAVAASDAAKALNLHPKIIGIDAAPEIGIKAVADGKIDATFIYPTEGHRIVRTALAILKGEPYDKVVKIPMTSPVNISNADILLSQNESLREETSRMKTLKTELDNYWAAHSEQRAFLYALIAIVLLVLVVLFILLRMYWQNRRHQQVLSQQNELLREQHETEKKLNEELKQQRDTEKNLREQLSEATQSKLTFYTNVSHDLRTPLTLIAEPLNQVSNAGNLTDSQHALLKLADKNVYILRRLINQILDFRKYENDKLSVHLSEVRLAPLLREWAESFELVAHKRHTKLSVNVGIFS